jgi:4-diphosphocytidyl-2-C-methyl-D-erythritol kinase
MNTVKVKAYAKINLSLNITGVFNGYHTLDSMVTSIDIFDVIVLHSRKDKLVNVYMKGMDFESLPMEKNNAFKAANLFVDAFNTKGADITIYKNIPEGAGLGGSSADAAGVLNGLKRLYNIKDDEKVKQLADLCGSDTGYMLKGGLARLKGRGEVIENLNTDIKLNLLMLIPKKGVSTAKCFNLYDSNPDTFSNQSELCYNAILQKNIISLSHNLYNALTDSAIKINSDIDTAIKELQSFSPLGVVMSGSGSAVFAIFENDQYVKWAKSRYCGKFDCIEVKTVNPQKNNIINSPYQVNYEHTEK